MQKIKLVLIAALLLSACSTNADINLVDKTLDSSSNKLGDVTLMNDITKQSENEDLNQNKDENNDVRLSLKDQRNMNTDNNEDPDKNTRSTGDADQGMQAQKRTKYQETTTLQVEDKKLGTGVEAISGKQVAVHYRGMLIDGTEFDNSIKRGEPFIFQLGAGQVIRGWDIGIEGMKVGGLRLLIIPPDLAYGNNSPTPAIPNGSTLVFEVQLVDVK